jgi:hypothetical protein
MLFSYCILVTLKFAAGQQTCRPSRAKLGQKDWAITGPRFNSPEMEWPLAAWRRCH